MTIMPCRSLTHHSFALSRNRERAMDIRIRQSEIRNKRFATNRCFIAAVRSESEMKAEGWPHPFAAAPAVTRYPAKDKTYTLVSQG
jgi:hypothetical protein